MCSCQKISGMKRKTSKSRQRTITRRRRSGVRGLPSTSQLQSVLLNQALPAGAGFYLSDKIVDMLPESSAKYSKYIKLVGGVALSVMGKGMVQAFGVGVAGAGVSEIINDAVGVQGVGSYLPGRPWTAVGSLPSGEGAARTENAPVYRQASPSFKTV